MLVISLAELGESGAAGGFRWLSTIICVPELDYSSVVCVLFSK